MTQVAPTNREFLQRQEARESNARSYPRRFPLALRSASGSRVTDVEGRTYLDCLAGAGTLALGHNHPEIVESLREALGQGIPLHTLDLATPDKDAFVEALFSTLPPAFREGARIQFCSPSGSDAVEAAIKLAKTATGRQDIVAFRGAYHGMSQGALSLMGSLGPKERLGALMPGTHFLPYPHAYRCPFGTDGKGSASLAAAVFESALRDPEGGMNRPAAVILEPVQGEGGVNPAPVEWLRQIRRTTHELGIPLILDEVQSGVGRTGTFYAFEKAGIVPDILVLSKAIGGGLPMAVVIYRPELDLWQPGAHAGTFRGNQLAMVAGRRTLAIVARDGLAARAREAGERLCAHLRAMAARDGRIGDVRGAGLMIGAEIVDPDGARDTADRPPRDGRMAALLQKECFRRRLILERGGRDGSVLRFLPPLTMSDAEIDEVAAILESSLGLRARAAA